jgi:hypothetical protein
MSMKIKPALLPGFVLLSNQGEPAEGGRWSYDTCAILKLLRVIHM